MNKRYFLSIIVTIIAIMAHTLSMTARPYCDVRKFSIVDGLAANIISDMKQAPDGLMWFSTWNGLSYYDGYSFYTFRDVPGGEDVLSSNRITAIYPTVRNNVWCVTSDRKIYLYSTHYCRFRNTEKNINEQFGINLKVDQLYPIKNGSTWITTKDGNYIIRAILSQEEEVSRELIKVGEHGLRSGKVWYVWSDKKGREWILTEKGTTIYKHHFSTPIPFKWVREVGENIFLATTDGKLAVFDERDKLVMIPMPKGVTRINQLKNTGYQLLIATNLGLVIYNPRTFKTELINVQSPSQPMAEVKNIYTDDFGMVWVFTDGMGVTQVNPKTGGKAWLFADQPDPADRTESDKFFITQDENKNLWIVPNGGTFSYFDRKAGKLVPYLLRSNSSGNFRVPRIKKFCLSDQGILWISGTHDLTQVAFKDHQYHLNGLDQGESDVRSLCNTPEGYHWTGYYNGIIQVSNSQFEKVGYLAPSGQVVPQQVKFCESPIFALFFDTEGKMWIGTRNDGLFVRTSQGMTHYTMNPADRNSLPSNNIFDIAADRHGRIWLATYGAGLVLTKQSATGQISFISKNNGMPWPKQQFQQVRRIFCTPTGEILVGTTEGLVTFGDSFSTPSKIKFFTSQHIENDSNSISANDIYFIMQHSNGQTLISQLGGMLENISSTNLLQNNLQTAFNRHISYDEGIVQSMVEDNQGNIWVVRESSIDCYNPKSGTTEVFGPNDFDLNMSFTEARPVHDPGTNNVTVGTPMGSLTFNPAKMKKSPYQARILFTMLHYTGESASEPILHKEKVEIPSDKRNLSISFASLDYSRKYNMKYRYRLDGHTPEGEWIDLGKRNYIAFNHIASGNYVLKVKATNSHGVWSKYVAELPIEVNPTFWESIWGKLFMLLMLLGIVAFIFYNYNRNQHEKLNHEMSLMKNDFFSNASHKLRTPLTLIGGPLKEVLDKENGLTRQGKEMITIALKNSYEMLEMINKILRFDNNSNLMDNSGLDILDKTMEEDEIPGQVDDGNAARYLADIKKVEKETEENMTEEEIRAKEEDRKDITVLVVEDNGDLRKFLYSILQSMYNVLLAENGKAGLLMSRTDKPDFIITDVTMPVMDGITMIKEIKQDHDLAQIPIIILSAKASVEDRLKGFEMGVDAYMTKPFSTQYLLGRIDAVIKQRRALQKEMLEKLEQGGNMAGLKNMQMIPEPKKTLSQITSEIAEKEREDAEKAKTLHESDFAFMASQINDKVTAKILKYVTENMGNPDLKIDDIAEAMGMSRSVLYAKIKQSVSMTPIDFVRHIRIMRASELLQQTDDTLASISFEVGFSDPKYFSKVFKKEMGIVPSEYRERTKHE